MITLHTNTVLNDAYGDPIMLEEPGKEPRTLTVGRAVTTALSKPPPGANPSMDDKVTRWLLTLRIAGAEMAEDGGVLTLTVAEANMVRDYVGYAYDALIAAPIAMMLDDELPDTDESIVSIVGAGQRDGRPGGARRHTHIPNVVVVDELDTPTLRTVAEKYVDGEGDSP